MTEELPYRAEYAKSGRASCKGCKEGIGKDTLRLAAMVQSPKFDSKIPMWYHHQCFFTKQRPKSTGDIAHFDSLRWDDQEKIKQKIGDGPGTGTSAEPKKGKKRAASAKGALKDFKIEYAKSSRAMCRGCELKINKDDVRVSKKDFESENARMYGGQDRWHHVDCFAKLRNELEFWEKGEDLPGFQGLSKEDKETVKKALPKTEAKIKKEADAVDSEVPVKKVKKEEENKEEDEKKKKQSKLMFKYRDALKELSKKELTTLLDYNGQEDASGVERKLDRLSDCMAFGALIRCSKCDGGQLVYKTGVGYVCTGDQSEWSKCSHTEREPKRKEFKVPEDMTDYSFLKKYKCKIGTRIIPYNTPTGSVKPDETDGPSEPKIARFAPLRNMVFFTTGRLSKSKDVIKKAIIDLGGSMTSKVGSTVAAVISSEDEIDKGSKHMDEAEKNKIPVVPDTLIDECKKNGADVTEIINRLNISPWPVDAKARIEASTKSMMKSKSGSMYTKSMPSSVKLKIKGGVAVDPDSNLEDEAHVYKKNEDIYNAILSKADLATGQNSYYKLQVLVSDNEKKVWLFRSWGRIGTTIGDTKLEKMGSTHEARKRFEELYRDKSGNEFRHRQNFVKVPGKMFPIDVDYGGDNIALSEVSGVNSTLPRQVQDLIRLIFDVDLMKKVMMEYELDLEKMPLGKLSRRQIEKAYGVLAELQNMDGDIKPNIVMDASNRFYTLIPHNFGTGAPPPLDNKELIQAKLEMLNSLLEMEVAYSLLKETKGEGDSGKHPVDRHYEKLNSKIDVLEHGSEEFEVIKKYVDNTHAETHTSYKLEVDDVFKVSRKGEETRYKPFKKLHNRKLLWHGSRTTNYAGILSQGLRIAPKEAPVTGYMFGKGVYFADMVTKSANYCNTNPANSTGLLLLCEVALGEMYEKKKAEFIEKLPSGKHSTMGVGATHPDPKDVHQLEDGVQVPFGKGVKLLTTKETSLLYNEFIVYDVAQVKIKYLLKVNFKYNY